MGRKAFPRSHAALIAEGYRYLFAAKCKDCAAAIHYYRTPGRKRLPFDVAKKIPHFWCCEALKRKRVESEAADPQLELFPW